MKKEFSDTALILAGGKSRRFGGDKALTEFGHYSLIEHVISQLVPVFNEVIISANDYEKYKHLGYHVCPDILMDKGPLAGIHSGLKAASNKWVFVTACDMPFISKKLISEMQNLIQKKAPTAVVPARNGFIEPFHGFYSKQLIPLIEQAALKKSCGIFSFLKMFKPEIVNCVDEDVFLNINTRKDLSALLSGNPG